MRIRTLNQDLNCNSLEVIRGNDGDIYVTVWEQKDKDSPVKPHTVRVGSAGSGHQLPSGVMTALSGLASVFEKYRDCPTEADALMKEQSEPYRVLGERELGMVEALIEREGPLGPERLAEFFGIPVQMLSMVRVNTKGTEGFLTTMLDYDSKGKITGITKKIEP